jgi:hypothetical protein
MVERGEYQVAERCSCPRGQALAERDRVRKMPPPKNFKPMITVEVATQAVEGLSAMQFFPSAPVAQTMIANELMAICHSAADTRWLITRMLRLYTKWPGIPELRHVYASRKRPADGIEPVGMSETFPEGIPSERGETQKAIGPAEPKRIGEPVSADPEIDRAIGRAAKLLGAIARKANRNVSPPSIPVNPDAMQITQSDVDAAVERYREQKAREELGGADA